MHGYRRQEPILFSVHKVDPCLSPGSPTVPSVSRDLRVSLSTHDDPPSRRVPRSPNTTVWVHVPSLSLSLGHGPELRLEDLSHVRDPRRR